MRSAWSSIVAVWFLAGACGGGGSSSPDGGGPPGGDAGAPDAFVGEPIEPEDPGPADVRIDVDTTADRHAISPFIYGTNSPDWQGSSERLTLTRLGGNRWTAYNWENNASNAGTDWYNQNDGFLGGGDTPGEAIRASVAEAHAAGASAIVTIPIAGYVAADKNGDGDVADSGPDYLETRFHPTYARKNGECDDPPDLGDDAVYADELVAWLEATFPSAQTDPARRILYSLDNEPDLWSSTHVRIHPDPVTYEELVARNIDFAGAIKAVAPDAIVIGPVNYGWQGFVNLQDAPDAAGRDFLEHWLDEMASAEEAQGRRLVDVLDLHWYPEAQGGGQRIIVDDASPAVAAARIQAPRSLWDASYTEESWIAMWSTQGPIRLVPRIREKIAAHYPGTELGFSEYYYGGGADISGGLAQADVLGVFGREDVFLATLWHIGSTDDRFIHGGFAMYRDYDGQGGSFGSISVRATSGDVEVVTGYASVDGDRVILVVVNKAETDTSVAVPIRHTSELSQVAVWQLTSASPTPAQAAGFSLDTLNSFVITLPSRSVSTLVID